MDPLTESLRGRLIVASPALTDPNFHRTVVLILEHSTQGAVGVVLNRPTEVAAADALPAPLAVALPHGAAVFTGGPVEPEAVIVLADFAVPEAAADIAFASVGIVDPGSDPSIVADTIRAARAFGGYAGWAGGQLEDEFAEEAWIETSGEVSDVFTDDPADLWSQVLMRKGGPYRLLARMPEDPTLN